MYKNYSYISSVTFIFIKYNMLYVTQIGYYFKLFKNYFRIE